MILGDVMDALAVRLDTIAGLRVHAYPPDTIAPPAAVVTYPGAIDFDGTYGRGMDSLELPVIVLVGKVSDRASRDAISRYADGSGSASIKAVLESGTYTAFDSIRVSKCTFDVIAIGAVEYLAATFTVSLTGSGE